MMETADSTLLQAYLCDGSQAAFAELVARHADWIYSMALRLVRDRQLAEDVTQAVFLALAKNGRGLNGRSIRGWLFKANRFVSSTAMRAEYRRKKHERQAAMMKAPHVQAASPGDWDQIAPRLEGFVARLRKSEREAVLLRFFQKKSMCEVGLTLGVSEEAARKRIARAVDKLRRSFRDAGVSAPGDALAATLATNATHAAPAALKISCASLSVSKAAGTFALVVPKMILRTKLLAGAMAGVIVALVSSTVAAILLAQASGSPNPASTAAAAAPPASQPAIVTAAPDATGDQKQMESWWADLAESDPQSSRALLHFAAQPEKTVAFLQTKMLPLTLTPERAKGLIEQLNSDDEATWKAAFEELRYFDPRLAIDLQTLMKTVTQTPARQRLVAVLSDRAPETLAGRTIILRKTSDGFNFYSDAYGSWWAENQVSRLSSGGWNSKQLWTRAVRGVVLLEQIGTPDAVAILSQMADGNPDALPTQVARDALVAQH